MEREQAEKQSKRVNRIFFRGYAGRNANVTQTHTGQIRADFTMNTGGGMKKPSESRSDSIYPPARYPDEWHYVVAWGMLGASCDCIKKGAHLEIEGRLTYYKDPTGRERAQIQAKKILVDGNDILQPEAHMGKAWPPQEQAIVDDEIPF
jgi:single-stranded DNA-binding protein